MGGVLQTLNGLSFTKELKEDGITKLDISIDAKKLQSSLDQVFARLAPTVEISGFRAGKAPKNLVIAKLGPVYFEEALKDLMPSCTYEVISHAKIVPLSQISYSVKKIAEGSGVDYSASFIAFPEFELPNFRKIKAKKEKSMVEKEEIDKVIEQMIEEQRKKDKNFKADDKWASSLNLGVKTLEELKTKVKEELLRQKDTNAQNKYLMDIIEKVAQQSKLIVPKALLDADLSARESEYKQRITKLGMKLEDFLRNQKTTIDEIRKNWVKESEEKLNAEIIFMKVAKEFDLKVEKEEIDKEISKIQDEKLKVHYENAENRNYLGNILLRQRIVRKIFELMEGK